MATVCEWCDEEYVPSQSEAMADLRFCSPECEGDFDEAEESWEID